MARSAKWMKHAFFAALVLFCVSASYGRGGQELVLCGSWIYDSLTKISLDAGTVDFTDSAPLSIQEIKTCLFEIDYNSLSSAGKREYDRVLAYFNDGSLSLKSGILSAGIDPSITPEGYYKSNSSVNWVYDRYKRIPFLDLPVTIGAGDFVTMYTDPYFGQNRGMMQHTDNYFNLPLSVAQMDEHFPFESYISTGYKFTENVGAGFQLGMGKQSVGRTDTGSIIFSEYMTGASYAAFDIYSPNIKYNMSVTQLGVDKYAYLHRYDLRFFKKISVSLLEGMLVNAPVELRYLNPMSIFHGMAPWRDYEPDKEDSESHTCAYFGFKFSFTPAKFVRIYGLYAQTQLQNVFEKANWPDSLTPDGLGGQLGTELYIPVGKGYIHSVLEGYYADPFLYIKESPNWSMVRTYQENLGDYATFYEWIGSPFGPDTIAGTLSVGYEMPAQWSLSVKYLFACRGQNSGGSIFTNCSWGGGKTDISADDIENNWAYPTASHNSDGKNWITPSGENPEYVNRLSVCGTWRPYVWLNLLLQPSYTVVINNGHSAGSIAQGFEIAASARFYIAKMFKISH
jgi:hypothetical protein